MLHKWGSSFKSLYVLILTTVGHGFHALLKVCSDREDTAPLIWAFGSYLAVNTHLGGILAVCIWKDNKQTKPIHLNYFCVTYKKVHIHSSILVMWNVLKWVKWGLRSDDLQKAYFAFKLQLHGWLTLTPKHHLLTTLLSVTRYNWVCYFSWLLNATKCNNFWQLLHPVAFSRVRVLMVSESDKQSKKNW